MVMEKTNEKVMQRVMQILLGIHKGDHRNVKKLCTKKSGLTLSSSIVRFGLPEQKFDFALYFLIGVCYNNTRE